MANLKVGVVGIGFIGVAHMEAIRRIAGIELYGVAVEGRPRARQMAEDFGVPRLYDTVAEMLADPAISAIHNCTPNHLHEAINEAAIRAGKHVFSEKPLAKNAAESERLLRLLEKNPQVVAGVNFCYRMNPLVQDAKNRIAAGEIGKPYLVHGSFLQDWLLFDTDYNWRIDPECSGESRCVADIGSHWMDTAQTLVGARITEVCANTVTVLPKRKKPKGTTQTFAVQTDMEYEETDIATEDYAGVLVRFENGVSGGFQCSEVSAGRKCWLDIEVDGSLASFHWQQEQPDRIWKGSRDRGNEEIIRNPNFLTPAALPYTSVPAGHPEGWNDALKNNVSAFYDYIRAGKQLTKDKPDFATFEDGHHIMKLIDAIMQSGKERRWITVPCFNKHDAT